MARKVKHYSGYNSKTPDRLLLDAGALFLNFTVGTDTYATAKAAGKCIGATQKGSEFSAKPILRRIELDGVHTRTIGDTLIDGWEVFLKTTVAEMTVDNIKNALGAATSAAITTGSMSGNTKIEGRDTILASDYISNITFIGNLLGEDDPVIIQVFNAFNENGLGMSFADKNNAGVEVQFYGYLNDTVYDSSVDSIAPPFAIYRPTEASTVSQGGTT